MPNDQPPVGATSPQARPHVSFIPIGKGKIPIHFADLEPAVRRETAAELGLKAFRADQIARYYFGHFEADPQLMIDLNARDRELAAQLLSQLITPVVIKTADQDWTQKTLWRLFDDAEIESVLMRYPKRITLCVSSQVGCGMGCSFCATEQLGLARNLSAGEILEQVRFSARAAATGALGGQGTRLSSIVSMGMGESLSNYRALLISLHTIAVPIPQGFGISACNLVVSTVGMVPEIRRLASEGIPVTLAVSLHALDDELRDAPIPMNRHYKIGQLFDIAHKYFEVTGRRVSTEYALTHDMNDHPWHAQLPVDELNKRGKTWTHSNPIPLNPTPGSIWTASLPHVMEEFTSILRQSGISTILRDTRGSDIDGACGQLVTASKNHKKAGVARVLGQGSEEPQH